MHFRTILLVYSTATLLMMCQMLAWPFVTYVHANNEQSITVGPSENVFISLLSLFLIYVGLTLFSSKARMSETKRILIYIFTKYLVYGGLILIAAVEFFLSLDSAQNIHAQKEHQAQTTGALCLGWIFIIKSFFSKNDKNQNAPS